MSNIRMVPHRPSADLFTAGAVDEDGMVLVDAAGDVGVAAGAEDGGGAGVGVDAGEVGRGEREAAIRVVTMAAVSWRKKAHSVSAKRRSSPPKMRAQNLKRESTSGKKGGYLFPDGGFRSRTGHRRGRWWIRI